MSVVSTCYLLGVSTRRTRRAPSCSRPPSYLSRYGRPQTGEVVDGDPNAARNLRDWPDHPAPPELP
jgi:hypothetical protein